MAKGRKVGVKEGDGATPEKSPMHGKAKVKTESLSPEGKGTAQSSQDAELSQTSQSLFGRNLRPRKSTCYAEKDSPECEQRAQKVPMKRRRPNSAETVCDEKEGRQAVKVKRKVNLHPSENSKQDLVLEKPAVAAIIPAKKILAPSPVATIEKEKIKESVSSDKPPTSPPKKDEQKNTDVAIEIPEKKPKRRRRKPIKLRSPTKEPEGGETAIVIANLEDEKPATILPNSKIITAPKRRRRNPVKVRSPTKEPEGGETATVIPKLEDEKPATVPPNSKIITVPKRRRRNPVKVRSPTKEPEGGETATVIPNLEDEKPAAVIPTLENEKPDSVPPIPKIITAPKRRRRNPIKVRSPTKEPEGGETATVIPNLENEKPDSVPSNPKIITAPKRRRRNPIKVRSPTKESEGGETTTVNPNLEDEKPATVTVIPKLEDEQAATVPANPKIITAPPLLPPAVTRRPGFFRGRRSKTLSSRTGKKEVVHIEEVINPEDILGFEHVERYVTPAGVRLSKFWDSEDELSDDDSTDNFRRIMCTFGANCRVHEVIRPASEIVRRLKELQNTFGASRTLPLFPKKEDATESGSTQKQEDCEEENVHNKIIWHNDPSFYKYVNNFP